MFDFNHNSKLNFLEFLMGMSLFTKQEEDVQIQKLFEIYDEGNTGYISKEEFLKMLYNYPK